MARVVSDELRGTIDPAGFIKLLAGKVGACREWTGELHTDPTRISRLGMTSEC